MRLQKLSGFIVVIEKTHRAGMYQYFLQSQRLKRTFCTLSPHACLNKSAQMVSL